MGVVARVYTYELEFRGHSRLPAWKGNIIRGALGMHLKRLYCMGREDCSTCNHLFRCPYGYLYRAKSKGIVLRNLEHFTKPYVIKPPLEQRAEYGEGDVISFSVVLFGDAIEFEWELLNAVRAMCRTGLGFSGSRGPLVLKRVCVENPFRNVKEFMYEEGETYDVKTAIRDRDLKVEIGRVFRITFLTPFRLIKNGSLLVEPSFRDLMGFMLRKYSAIMYQYVRSGIDVDVDKVIAEAEKVGTVRSDLRDRTFVYRGREEKFVHGSITYSGRLSSKARKVLAFCQLSHVGKRASYGHGWYEVI